MDEFFLDAGFSEMSRLEGNSACASTFGILPLYATRVAARQDHRLAGCYLIMCLAGLLADLNAYTLYVGSLLSTPLGVHEHVGGNWKHCSFQFVDLVDS